MIEFNDYFSVTGNEYLNINLEGDTTLFLDPNKIKKVKTNLFDKDLAERKIKDYFFNVNNLYKLGEKEKAIDLINNSKEIHATRLGYSKGNSGGKGASADILDKVFSQIQKLGELNTSLLSQPCLIPLFVHNFNKDRFSDLLTNIICKELSDFTNNICDKYEIKRLKKFKFTGGYDLKNQCWKPMEVLLPYDDEEKPIILVPKEMTVSKFDFNIYDYIYKTILVKKQMEHLENKSPLTKVKWDPNKNDFTYKCPAKKLLYKLDVKEKYPYRGGPKAYAIKESIKDPHLLAQYISQVENK